MRVRDNQGLPGIFPGVTIPSETTVYPSTMPKPERAPLEHPTEEQLRDYCGGTIDPEAFVYIEHHIIDCDRCSRQIAEIIRAEDARYRTR
jgi:hypothetical protein